MRHLRAIVGILALFGGGRAALAQEIPDLVGTWHPSSGGTHVIQGPSRHQQSGTKPVEGGDELTRHTSKFVFRFEGQEGRSFWGKLSSAAVSEKLVGAISVDGKRFVMADEDGSFAGFIVDVDTLDYCYTHTTGKDIAAACGLLVREK